LKQAEIWLADLDPAKGIEQGKIRPVLIISGDTMNENFPVVIACPLSTIIKNYEGCVVIYKNKINKLTSDSEVITFQVRTISKDRLIKKMGNATALELENVIAGLNDVLTY
jgi:mRNA interferase MazF